MQTNQVILTYGYDPVGKVYGYVRDNVLCDNYGEQLGVVDQTTNSVEVAGEKLPLRAAPNDGRPRLRFTNGAGVTFFIEERKH